MLTLLRTPRWQGFTAVVVVAIVAFGFLSRWQWDRAEQKQQQALSQSISGTEAITPSPTDPLPEFTPVRLTGEYVPESLRFVRQRPLEGRNGFWVMQQLRTNDGTVWLLRGWTPSGIRAGDSPNLPLVSPWLACSSHGSQRECGLRWQAQRLKHFAPFKWKRLCQTTSHRTH